MEYLKLKKKTCKTGKFLWEIIPGLNHEKLPAKRLIHNREMADKKQVFFPVFSTVHFLSTPG